MELNVTNLISKMGVNWSRLRGGVSKVCAPAPLAVPPTDNTTEPILDITFP